MAEFFSVAKIFKKRKADKNVRRKIRTPLFTLWNYFIFHRVSIFDNFIYLVGVKV